MRACEQLFGLNRAVEIHKLVKAATGRECSCAGGDALCVAGEAAAFLIEERREAMERLSAAVSEAYQ